MTADEWVSALIQFHRATSLSVALAQLQGWPFPLTRDDRDFLKQIHVRADDERG